MNTIKFTILGFILFSISGCINLYQYQSRGELTIANNTYKAVLYWQADSGRLWYGKPYHQADSNVVLRVCYNDRNYIYKDFNNVLFLPSKARDISYQDNAQGEMVSAGQNCGKVSIDSTTVNSQALIVGNTPLLSFWCASTRKPDRYPLVGEYQFSAISRKIVDKKHTQAKDRAPDPCE